MSDKSHISPRVSATTVASVLTRNTAEAEHQPAISLDPATFRDAMSRVAAPVTVVTTMAASTPYGTTVSSFSSLSMSPPLVMFALDRRSQLLVALQCNRRLAINVLGHGQDDLAATFARRQADRFCDTGWYTSAGLPRLPGIAAWFECRSEQFIAAGDHEIVLAAVIKAEIFDGLPLMYAQRTFGTHSGLLSAACQESANSPRIRRTSGACS